MKFNKIFVFLFFFICVFQINSYSEEICKDSEDCNFVAVVQLVANPEAFNGKKVCVIGYVIIGFEESAIYLSEESAEHGILKNSLFLSVNTKEYEQFNEKYCIIEGTFDSSLTGQWRATSGGLKDIIKFNEWDITRTKIKESQNKNK